MVVGEANINNIMSGIESTGGVRLHNHRKKLKQRFDIIKKLGQGTYGKVQLGINKETGQEVAIKTIKKCKIETEADLIRIRREIQIMSSVQHPNIIHIYEVFENREKMVLVMEYAAGGELYDYLSERKVLLEEEARRIFRQIATAVYYCHKHKICHRDLKLENILLDENGNAKIADFGLSNVFDETRLLSTFCGSPLYASPEIVKGTPYHGPEVDCWSLGVLLYTLVYGAMPFDGSNFKRLVKQISQGDYFEPKTPSPASPLIREMLTVSPNRRADMEKICSHWWVNEGHDESCLDIAEDLANQTPVRLDLLLSIAPPPPQIGSDKLVIASTENVTESEGLPDASVPARSQSVGSIMERAPTQKIRDIIEDDTATANSPKRKLEITVSTENANQASSGAKRKERSRKKDRDSSVDRRSHRSSSRSKTDKIETAKLAEEEQNLPPSDAAINILQKNLTQTMEVESQNGDLPVIDKNVIENNLSPPVSPPQEEGAMCTELIEEANKKSIASREKRKSVKTKKPKPETMENKIIEESDVENVPNENNLDKENIAKINEKQIKSTDPDVSKVPKKKILGDNNEAIPNEVKETEVVQQSLTNKDDIKLENGEDLVEKNEEVAQPPTKPIERRRSKIFETAEKFQNMASSNDQKSNIPEKPKKIFIPGVNVGGFKQAFERRASLTNSSPVKTSMSKKTLTDENKKPTEVENIDKNEPKPIINDISSSVTTEDLDKTLEDEKREKVKHAVSVISNAIDREGARKSKSRPTMIRKPPVPFGISGRSASGGIAHLVSPLSPSGNDNKRQLKLQVGPEMRTATVHVTTPEDTNYIQETVQQKREQDKIDEDSDTKTSSIEVNLKSATLPRRKTSKAEITLSYPQPKPATMEFKTEMQHRIENNHPRLKTQRSEVAFPVSAAPHLGFRSTSLEPESKDKPKERIIPIALEEENQSGIRSPPTKPPAPRMQRALSQGQRASSMSRQSTQDSDTDSTSTQQEPIRKSPREFIIPIAIEGGGYVTPRAGSLEPSESGTPTSKFSSTSRFGRPRRMNSLLSDREGSEDESPFSTLHRHGSVGRDSDNEDSRKDRIHLHRLRSTRPNKKLEHADSLSSGEEDDDDGFELLTAENLFSTLLSRVRSLTQRLNVEDGGRPGFPSSRLLSHFGRDNFWDNLHNREPFRNSFGRSFSRDRDPQSTEANNGLKQAPWRRTSTNRFATESNPSEATTTSQTLPRDTHDQNTQDLNLSDLDLSKLKLSENDAVALSYLTPGLSRRIKQQLLSQLPPSQARKLTRTLSKRENSNIVRSEIDNTTTRRSSEGQLPQTDQISNKDFEKNNKQKNIKQNENTESTSNIKTDFMNRRSMSYDPNYKSTLLNPNDQISTTTRSSSREKFSPLSESSRSEYTDLSSRSDSIDYQNILTSIHNSDLTESDRRLLENYRKSREQRRAMRSNSLLDSTRSSSYYKPPLPEYDDEKSVLSKYLNTYSSDPLRSRTSTLNDYKSDYLKSRTLDRRNTSTTPRRISRFLRPDFYDTPSSDNVLVKEKSERELETQKVLKEIRDKRLKKRLGLRETSQNDVEKTIIKSEPKPDLITPSPPVDTIDVAATKSKIAKLIRPKSFPEKRDSPPNVKDKKEITKDSSPSKNEKEKSLSPQKLTNSGDDKSDSKPVTNRNKFLHSLEKKFEKLRSFSTTPSDSSTNEGDKLSRVGNAIRRLREQSLPRTTEHFTESGLIKRAISVEDLSSLNSINNNNNNMKISKKSVSKILNLFKKYEEPKSKKSSTNKTTKDVSNNCNSNKTDTKKSISKVTKESTPTNGETTVKTKSKIPSKSVKKSTESNSQNKSKIKKEKVTNANENKELPTEKVTKIEKPLEQSKKDTIENKSIEKLEENVLKKESSVEKDENKTKVTSKLPIFRRSIDLGESQKINDESTNKETRKSLNILENTIDNTRINNGNQIGSENPKRKSLQLDFSKLPRLNLPPTQSVDINHNEDSITKSPTDSKTDDGLLSPRDDSSVENWSASSPDYADNSYHHPISDYSSALSPSGDESESVIDRIRRKSFYTRFNEKKKIRKSSLVGPGADYNNHLSYKTSPRHLSLKDDTKIHLEPLSSLTFRAKSPLNDSMLKHYEVDSYITKKNPLLSGSIPSPSSSSAYNSRRKTNKLSMDWELGSRSTTISGKEDTFEQPGNISRVNSYNVPSTPLSNIDVNSNLRENNNDSPDH